MTTISKRVERGETVDVYELYRGFLTRVAELREEGVQARRERSGQCHPESARASPHPPRSAGSADAGPPAFPRGSRPAFAAPSANTESAVLRGRGSREALAAPKRGWLRSLAAICPRVAELRGETAETEIARPVGRADLSL